MPFGHDSLTSESLTAATSHISPGGYFEIQDFSYPARCDDNTMTPDSAIVEWCNLTLKAAATAGRPLFPTSEYKNYLRDAGFEDIVETVHLWPTNRWPKDPRHKDIGSWCLANLEGGLEGITTAHFTRALGWTVPEVLALCARVRKELRDPKIHVYFPM